MNRREKSQQLSRELAFYHDISRRPSYKEHNNSKWIENSVNIALRNEEFINAKYQLLVTSRNDTDVTIPSNNSCQDPNILQAWTKIRAVVVQQTGQVECPICLYPPVAPRMDKCGHIYCLACLKQYIDTGPNCQFRKCAICEHYIDTEQLKRVHLLPPTNSMLQVGEEFAFSLVRKPFGKFSDPVLMSDEVCLKPAKWLHMQRFRRVVPTNNENYLRLVREELEHLQSNLAISKVDELSFEVVPFLEKSLRSVRGEERELVQALSSSGDDDTAKQSDENCQSVDRQAESSLEKVYFYQASDGQDVYLCGLNWRCLQAEHARGQLPMELKARVLDVRRHVISYANRRLFRHLSHLPDGRDICLVELDLTSALSPAVLEQFAKEIQAHAEQRKAREEVDRRLTRLKIEHENRFQQLASNFQVLGHVDLTENLPVPTKDDFVPLSPQTVNSASVSSPPCPALKMSFAEASRVGAAALVSGPARKMRLVRESTNVASPSLSSNAIDDFPSLSPMTIPVQDLLMQQQQQQNSAAERRAANRKKRRNRNQGSTSNSTENDDLIVAGGSSPPSGVVIE